MDWDIRKISTILSLQDDIVRKIILGKKNKHWSKRILEHIRKLDDSIITEDIEEVWNMYKSFNPFSRDRLYSDDEIIEKEDNRLQEAKDAQSYWDEDMTQLEKVLQRMKKKWVHIEVSYNWLPIIEQKPLKPYVWWNTDNVLVIGDLHSPYIIDWYLEHCREVQQRYNCGTVVYIWDIVDFHSISYHEKSPEELNPRGEIARARQILKIWYATFPKAIVTLWNHDQLPRRQARTMWLLKEYLHTPETIFESPKTYKFVDEIVLNWVLYTHWSTSDAFKKCIIEWMSMVSWHKHTLCWVQYTQTRSWKVRGMQVWAWIDYKAETFSYSKTSSKHPITACWVVINKWKEAYILPL